MPNNLRSLADIPVAYMNDDSWIWKDDMIVFQHDDGFYDDEFYDADDLEYEATWYNDGSAERILADLPDEDHPICGEFPHDSIVAPRGWDKVD